MEEGKNTFQFERFNLGRLEFNPRNIEGEIEYNVSFSPQRREDDETNLRIVVELSLSDSNNKEQFFFSEHTGYFLVSENFKEFNINNESVRQMIMMILEDLKNLLYIISTKTFDRPLVIDFDEELLFESVEEILDEN